MFAKPWFCSVQVGLLSFTRRLDGNFIAALFYVDDMLLTGDDHEGIQRVKQALDKTFTSKDLGFARYFLGIGIA